MYGTLSIWQNPIDDGSRMRVSATVLNYNSETATDVTAEVTLFSDEEVEASKEADLGDIRPEGEANFELEFDVVSEDVNGHRMSFK